MDAKMIGFRCSNLDYTYAVVSKNAEAFKLVETKTVGFPKNFCRVEALRWFYLEIEQLLKRIEPSGVMLKRAEMAAAKSKSFVERVENEGVILLVSGMLNSKYVRGKVKATLLKDLGYKGRGRYFQNAVNDAEWISGDDISEKMVEAALVARSGFKDDK